MWRVIVYSNQWTGEIDRFSGEEKITKDDEIIYQANYLGGEVDKRAGI